MPINSFWQKLLRTTCLVACLFCGLAQASLLPMGSHCVAYKARKRLLLVTSVSVVGKSCEVAAQVTPEVGGLYRFEISFPIVSLKSGEHKRDQDVAKLLEAEKNPEIHFVTEPLSHSQWQDLLKKNEGVLQGELRYGQKVHPLKVQVSIVKNQNEIEVDGVIKTSFKELQLKAPKLVMGLFANVRNDLELHFHLRGNRTLGAESIL